VIFAILPVKSPRAAKERLREMLTAEQRETLARMLFRRTLATLCSADGIDRVVVVTSDLECARSGRDAGALVLEETAQVSHSQSADAACRRVEELGASTAMLVPIDVPTASAADFSQLAASAGTGLVVVPSEDGTGTNALVRTPPSCIESRFGPGSFKAHLEQAASRGIPAKVLRIPGLMFDIDTPEDIDKLLKGPTVPEITAFLEAACAWR
jgi:2-phospho-L-lactate/phosphoenolpyruvate guanylyltransferase